MRLLQPNVKRRQGGSVREWGTLLHYEVMIHRLNGLSRAETPGAKAQTDTDFFWTLQRRADRINKDFQNYTAALTASA